MSYSLFHTTHLIAVFFLVACVAYALAGGGERKKLLMWSGIASLVAFLSGFGLLGILKAGVPFWSIVKIVCWFLLSGIVGMAFRMREKSGVLRWLAIASVLIAILMVSYKPL